MIHKTAIIDSSSIIDNTVEIGPYTVIGKNVKIEKNTSIDSHCYIEHAQIGENCKIFPHTCIGTAPQDFKYKDKKTSGIIGNNCTIREFATVHRGSLTDATIVGDNCYIMAYGHVAHDCILGDEVVLANCASLGGHVKIDAGAVIGGLVAIHQFCRIGKLVMLGGGTMVTVDVPPYMMGCGDRVKLYGLNLVGLKRKGFSQQRIELLRTAYKILFLSKITLAEALKQIEEINQKFHDIEIENLINFIKESKRGICRP